MGRALAHKIYLILVDPATAAHKPNANALDIAIGSFGAAQRRIFEASLRAASIETRGKRLFVI